MDLSKITKKNNRTTNTVYNFITNMGGQLITIFLHFLARTVFIYTLGKSYLGISGLFSNILSMLELAEFGVGSAIIFKLYDPVAREDHHRIAVLMKFYKSVYTVIGLAVAIVGCILIPFLPYLISDYDKIIGLNINAVFIYCLYLIKSVSTYLFFAYKSAIIKVNQKEYLLNIINYCLLVGTTILQIAFLLLRPNFTVYVMISVMQIIVYNMTCAYLADKMYPYINEKTTDRLPIGEIKEVFKDCAAIFLYKLNAVVLKATDNLVLSIYLGLDTVAEYSNYYILYITLNTLLNRIFNSVSHSLGNLYASENKDKAYQVFESTMLITAILGGTAGAGIAVVSDELIMVWLGKEWVIAKPFAFLMGAEVFTLTFRIAISKFRTTMGLFQQAKFRPLAGMLINLIVSVALVKKLGICGVLLGTIIADWSTLMWFDPVIIHRYGYNKPEAIRRYFIKLLKYVSIALILGTADNYICQSIFCGMGWGSVFFHAVIVGITVPSAYVALCYKKPEGQYVVKLGQGYLKAVSKKIRNKRR